MDIPTAVLIMVCAFLVMIVFVSASEVGKVRAIAAIECYKAAQVNTNINCGIKD